jgi:hypothetical protein
LPPKKVIALSFLTSMKTFTILQLVLFYLNFYDF